MLVHAITSSFIHFDFFFQIVPLGYTGLLITSIQLSKHFRNPVVYIFLSGLLFKILLDSYKSISNLYLDFVRLFLKDVLETLTKRLHTSKTHAHTLSYFANISHALSIFIQVCVITFLKNSNIEIPINSIHFQNPAFQILSISCVVIF